MRSIKPKPFDTSGNHGKLLAKRKDFCREFSSGSGKIGKMVGEST
jgi:hypothetical protein